MNIRDYLKKNKYYLIGVAACLFFVITRPFHANLVDHELVYSLNPILLLHPDFLKNDFFFGTSYPFFLPFDTLTAFEPLKVVFFFTASLLMAWRDSNVEAVGGPLQLQDNKLPGYDTHWLRHLIAA